MSPVIGYDFLSALGAVGAGPLPHDVRTPVGQVLFSTSLAEHNIQRQQLYTQQLAYSLDRRVKYPAPGWAKHAIDTPFARLQDVAPTHSKRHVHLRDRKAPPWPTDLNERWWE